MFNFKKLKSNSGAALIMILIVMVVLFILGTSLLNVSLSENKFAIAQEKGVKSYYIARAGAEAAATYIMDDSHTFSEINTLLIDNDDNIDTWSDFSDGQFKVSFGGNAYDPVVHSVGNYDGIEKTTSVKLSKLSLFGDAAITVTEGLFLANNSLVGGTVATTNDPETSVLPVENWDNIEGGDPYQTDTVFEDPDPSGLDPAPPPGTISFPITIEYGDGVSGYSYNTIDLGSKEMNVNLNNGDVKLQASTFEGNNATINVTGDGLFTLYVDTINFKGDLIASDESKVLVIVYDEGNINFQTGNSIFNAFIYGPSADMTIKANYTGLGAIIGRNVSLESGGQVRFNPNNYDFYPEEAGLDSLGYVIEEWND